MEGDVIGFESIDGGMTTHPDCWNITMSKVEVLCMRADKFELMWNLQCKKVQNSSIYNFVKYQAPFCWLSAKTLHLVACELAKKQSFTGG